MKFNVTIPWAGPLPPGTYEAEVTVTESPRHAIVLDIVPPRPERASRGLLVRVEAKDEYDPDEDGTMVRGYLPPAETVASLVQDVMADTTKHDRTTGWRVVSVEAVP